MHLPAATVWVVPAGLKRAWSLQAFVWRRSRGDDEASTIAQRPRGALRRGESEGSGKKKLLRAARGATRSSRALGRAIRCPGRWRSAVDSPSRPSATDADISSATCVPQRRLCAARNSAELCCSRRSGGVTFLAAADQLGSLRPRDSREQAVRNEGVRGFVGTGRAS